MGLRFKPFDWLGKLRGPDGKGKGMAGRAVYLLEIVL